MSYATIAQFVTAFPNEAVGLTTHDAQANAPDEVVLQAALDDSSSIIDSYLRGRYSLPFPSVPVELVPRELDITRYRLDRNDPMEDVRLRYEDAIAWLKQVRDGDVLLDVGTEETTVNLIQATERDRKWDAVGLGGFGG